MAKAARRHVGGAQGTGDGGGEMKDVAPEDAPAVPSNRDRASRGTGRGRDGPATVTEWRYVHAAARLDVADDGVARAPQAGVDVEGGPDFCDGLGGCGLAGYDHAGRDDADAARRHAEDADDRVSDADLDAIAVEGGDR